MIQKVSMSEEVDPRVDSEITRSVKRCVMEIAELVAAQEQSIRERGGGCIRSHVLCKVGKLYVRAGQRYTPEGKFNSIELASITIHSRFQRQGFLKRLLDVLEVLADQPREDGRGRVLFVENVINGHLDDYLRNRRPGYISSTYELGPQTYRRLPKIAVVTAGGHVRTAEIPAD